MMKNRIAALNRNQEHQEKKARDEERYRQTVYQGIENRKNSCMAKIALQESRFKTIEQKQQRASSMRKERSVSAMQSKRENLQKKQAETLLAKQMTSERKEKLEQVQNKRQKEKLMIAMELRKQKDEAKAKKAQLD